MEVLARRTMVSSGKDIAVEVVATGNGPALRAEGCPMVPLSLHETHRLLSRLGRAADGEEGLTRAGERLAAVLGELA